MTTGDKIPNYERIQLTNEKFVNLYRLVYNFSQPVGQNPVEDKKWTMASRKEQFDNKPDAVVIVPILSDNDGILKIVMTKEFRYPIMDYEYGFPAGLIDDNETPEEAAKRELKEETGLDMDFVIEKTPNLYSSAGMTDESSVIIFAMARGDISTDGNEPAENIEVFTMEFSDVKEFLQSTDKKISVKAWLILRMITGFKLG